MERLIRRAFNPVGVALLCIVLSGVFSCTSTSPDLVKQEDGFYYGYGTGSSSAEAADRAKQELISNALTATLKTVDPHAGRVVVSIETARKIDLKLQPFAERKEGADAGITYRIKTTEWDRFEASREAALLAELLPRVQNLTSTQPLAGRIENALGLLTRLTDEGVSKLLKAEGPGPDLLADRIIAICKRETGGVRIDITPDEGFIGKGTTFRAQVLDKSGNGLAKLHVKAQWTAPDTDPITVTTLTNSIGNAIIEYPAGESFRNRPIGLLVMTDFSAQAPAYAAIKDLDRQLACECRYEHLDDPQAFFGPVVRIPAGPFTAGALAKDKRASKNEAVRTVTTGEYYMSTFPVTNSQYAMYLHAINAEEFPEYWDNPDYNQPEQPVIGVSWEDANQYAAWLSSWMGAVYRLPAEDEWEKAARAGLETIYPWGDDSPLEGEKANYNGNSRFKGPSPVGAFEIGKNNWGIYDMAGNVWQWTSTTKTARADGAASRTVKGGSWMDGPHELRISNRRDLAPGKGYVDVGFRLLREVNQ